MTAKRVITGAENLLNNEKRYVDGKRVGLLTNPTGRTGDLQSVIDLCAQMESCELTALFACEHGIRGEKQAGIRFEDERDEQWDIPVYSLYGERKKPTAEMLGEVDAVLFDIQDLGLRFYTYLSTLIYTMEACAENGKELIVLDRPNPLGGERCEGGLLTPGMESMVGAWAMPIRTGLTIGEFARLVNDGLPKKCDLVVVPLENWNRAMDYTDTGLPWILPSPNIPTLDTARVYPGTCFFEGTRLSEGRGTTKPFEQIGAPWVDAERLAKALEANQLPGVRFCPVYFTPTFSKHQGELCAGVQLFVTDKESFRPVETGLHLLREVMRLHPDHFEWLPPRAEGGRPFIDLLTGSTRVKTELGEPGGLEQIVEEWNTEALEWQNNSRTYWIYT
ncbi:exo-beta-N-acetylmuramidase NamZ family protein [Paenibacillus senegalensis]|uniref:exo-beta-N-acetylmuramidase NamZ family protein n=1 Tax=Paenibacillus senegalensis TaxID=1465766 RepID=UPI0002892B8B|nr:DUF1343 domain-containing protein [Paenibacillus senegalensis]